MSSELVVCSAGAGSGVGGQNSCGLNMGMGMGIARGMERGRVHEDEDEDKDSSGQEDEDKLLELGLFWAGRMTNDSSGSLNLFEILHVSTKPNQTNSRGRASGFRVKTG